LLLVDFQHAATSLMVSRGVSLNKLSRIHIRADIYEQARKPIMWIYTTIRINY